MSPPSFARTRCCNRLRRQQRRSKTPARRRSPNTRHQATTNSAPIGPPQSNSTTAQKLNDLFFAANADERRLILLSLDVVAPVPAARRRVAHDPSVGQHLEAAVLSGKRDDFAHQLARALSIPRDQAHRIAGDELGEPVVVAGKVLRVPRDVLYRILMFVNPAVGHSVERVHALAVLYDEIMVPAAEEMLAIWQALQHHERTAARHQPLAWDDETHRSARPAPSVQRHPAVPPRTGERRSAS